MEKPALAPMEKPASAPMAKPAPAPMAKRELFRRVTQKIVRRPAGESKLAVAVPVSSVLVLTSPPGGQISPSGALEATPLKTTMGQSITKLITASQLNNLAASQVQILPPPGPNTAYIITELAVSFKFVAPVYIGANGTLLYYGADGTVPAFGGALATCYVGASADAVGALCGEGGFDSAGSDASFYVNQPIFLINPSLPVQGGGGSLTIFLRYQTFTVPS
jgi:hypothetical protein